MRPENKRMQAFLRSHGINAVPKWIATGSLKRSWRLYDKGQPWTMDLVNKLTGMGFRGLNGPLDRWDGNGGVFSVFVRGHEEFLTA